MVTKKQGSTRQSATDRAEQTTTEAKAIIERDLTAAREKTKRLKALREAQASEVEPAPAPKKPTKARTKASAKAK